MVFKINSSEPELVDKINKALSENFKKYGKQYCPCSLIHDEDHICPCNEFLKSDKLGKCHCGKYIKVES